MSFVPVLGEVQTILRKGEDDFLNEMPPGENDCRGWNCHGLNERPLWKGFG